MLECNYENKKNNIECIYCPHLNAHKYTKVCDIDYCAVLRRGAKCVNLRKLKLKMLSLKNNI